MHQTEYRMKDPYKSFPDFKKQDENIVFENMYIHHIAYNLK